VSTLAFDLSTLSAIVAASGENTHFQYSGSIYQKNDGVTPDPQAEAVVSGVGMPVYRERLSYIAVQKSAVTDLDPMKLYAQVGDINSTDAEVRAVIHSYATDTGRRNLIFALTGSNEPNKSGTYTGAGHWYDQAVLLQYSIWDQVMIEVAAGNWGSTAGVNRPYVVGCALMHEHVPYDTDIAHLAAATFTTAGIAYHMADLCDSGDFHFYAGWDGPGFRMNGKDDNGATPAGVSTGSDGKVSIEAFEVQRARQVYDLKLTGGSGALSSGHWKYTGGSVTAGHGATFPMNHSEWGTPIDNESGHTDLEWQARGAVYGPETLLRDFNLGVGSSIVYQALNDKKTDGLRLGMYNLTLYPAGAFPIYTAFKTLFALTGVQSFTGLGSFTDVPVGAVLPAASQVNLFSTGVTGHWDLYLTKEADPTYYLTLNAGYVVQDVTLDGDGTYHLTMDDSLKVFHIIPADGGGGKPVWTDYRLANKVKGGAYTDGIAATGATSYAIVSGTLPPGASLNTSTGAITGTVTTEGLYPLQWSATNGSGTVESPDTVTTIFIAPVFGTISPSAGTVGVAYSYDIPLTAGFPDSVFKMAAGTTLPPGLVLSTDGNIGGVPTTAGTTSGIKVSAQNNTAGAVTSSTFSITVSGSGGGGTIPVWSDFTLPDGQKGNRYGPDTDGDGIGDGFDLSDFVASGTEDCTYTVASGAIAHNTVLSASGNLRGKCDTVEDLTVSFLATNSAGSTESPVKTYSVIDNENHGSGQSITIELDGHGKSAFVVYGQVWDSTLQQAKSARLIQIEDVNKNAIAIINMKQSGQIAVDDPDGNSIGKGDQRNFAVSVGSDSSDQFRISGVVSWDGTQTRLTVWAYGKDPQGLGSCESLEPTDTVVCIPVASAEPFAVTAGNEPGKVYYTVDSVLTHSGTEEIGPLEPESKSDKVAPAFTMTGGTTSTGTIVKTITDPGAYAGRLLDLAFTTDVNFGTQSLNGSRAIDAFGTATQTVGGLTQNTTYYGRAVDSGSYVGETFTFKTEPDGSGAWTRKIAVMSCLSNPSGGSTPQFVFDDIVAWAPDEVWHQGDLGYWGQDIDQNDPPTRDVQKHIKVAQKLPRQRAVFQCASHNVLQISDHELHSNSDGETNPSSPDYDGDATGSFNCPHAVRELLAFQSMRPVRTYLDTRVPRRDRSYFFDIGQQVRVIVADFRTPDRSFYDDPESSSKSMFGAVQTANLRAVFDPNKVNFFVVETPWWHGHSRAVDKPARYSTNQADWEAFLTSTGDYTGGPVYPFALVAGDRHRSSFLDDGSTGNPLPGPQYVTSGLLKNALALDVGETVDWSTYTPDNTTDKFTISQYGQLTLSYDGADTVTAKWNIRVVDTLRQVTDGSTINGSPTITSQTAAWTDADKGSLIAGDGIVNTDGSGNDKPTYILSVSGDGVTATMSNPAKATRNGNADWTIQNNLSQWGNVYDFPGGSVTTNTWTLSGGGGGGFAPEWVEG
jgi:hypothetical protein